MLVNPIYYEYLHAKQVLWQAVNSQTAFHQCLLCLLRKNQQSPGTNIHQFKDCQPLLSL